MLAFLFVVFLLLVGILLIALVRSNYLDATQPDAWQPVVRPRPTDELRRMARRRERIWWRIDDLHAEFVQRASPEKGANALTPASAPAPERVAACDGITPADVRDAYELFLHQRVSTPGRAHEGEMRINR